MPRARRWQAFTIIELLVAATVTSLLAALLLGLAAQVLKMWNRTAGVLQAGNQARLVFDQLEQDLPGACFRTDGGVWLAATVQPDQTGAGDAGLANASWNAGAGGCMKPGNSQAGTAGSSLNLAPASGRIEDCRFGMAGIWLRFFTAQSDTNGGQLQNVSAPRAIAYQIVRLRAAATNAAYHYNLYRSQVRPGGTANATFSLGFDLFMPATANPSYNRADGVDPAQCEPDHRQQRDRFRHPLLQARPRRQSHPALSGRCRDRHTVQCESRLCRNHQRLRPAPRAGRLCRPHDLRISR
jgi:hypothetical protein